MVIRASSISKLMTKPRTKSESFSETALTHLKELALEEVLGIRQELDNKYVEKGKQCEYQSIELLNKVLFENYTKHQGRQTKHNITGECDILTPTIIRDVKTSWSVNTFPWFYDDAVKSIKAAGYEWQMRAYMMLYDVDKAAIDYCLTSTPDELYGWEDETIHVVDHINESKRVTSVYFERDKELEALMIDTVQECQEKYNELVNELLRK
jgi:hypothetical protein